MEEYKNENEKLKRINLYIEDKIKNTIDGIDKEIQSRNSTSSYNLKSLSDLIEIKENLTNNNNNNHNLDYDLLIKELINDDGTTSPKWNIDDTTSIARDYNIDLNNPEKGNVSVNDWYLALNMIYSDYCDVAKKYNIDIPEFYVDLTKAFLFDKDTKQGKKKLEAYFYYVK